MLNTTLFQYLVITVAHSNDVNKAINVEAKAKAMDNKAIDREGLLLWRKYERSWPQNTKKIITKNRL